MNRSRSWFVKILKGQRPLDHAVIKDVIEVAGISPGEFWGEYFDELECGEELRDVLRLAVAYKPTERTTPGRDHSTCCFGPR